MHVHTAPNVLMDFCADSDWVEPNFHDSGVCTQSRYELSVLLADVPRVNA